MPRCAVPADMGPPAAPLVMPSTPPQVKGVAWGSGGLGQKGARAERAGERERERAAEAAATHPHGLTGWSGRAVLATFRKNAAAAATAAAAEG